MVRMSTLADCLKTMTNAEKRGKLGIKISIMLPFDPTGKIGPDKPIPDQFFFGRRPRPRMAGCR